MEPLFLYFSVFFGIIYYINRVFLLILHHQIKTPVQEDKVGTETMRTTRETAIDQQTARERIGHLVREHREKAGLTVRELAEKAGITHSHIVRIEAGRYNVTVDTLDKLGKVLGFKLGFVKD